MGWPGGNLGPLRVADRRVRMPLGARAHVNGGNFAGGCAVDEVARDKYEARIAELERDNARLRLALSLVDAVTGRALIQREQEVPSLAR